MKRRHGFFAAACALLVVAAWLMARGDRPIKPPPPHVAFQHHQGQEEQRESQRRRTLAPSPQAPESNPPKRDPLLTALPPRSKSTVVFEAKALRQSPIAKLWLDCLMTQRQLDDMAGMKKVLGVNPLEDIDRFAVSSDKVSVVSGNFSSVPWEVSGSRPRAYGVDGRIYEPSPEAGSFGIWNGQVLLMGQNAASIEAAIDRLEDRAPPEPPPIPDWSAYGDVYGFLDAQELAEGLPPDQQELASRFRSALDRVEFHVDTSDDVAITANATGPSPDDVTDLSKTLGGALALGRLKAQADGNAGLADMLELAQVSPRGNGRFSFDLALPMDLIKRHMGPCHHDADGGGAPPAPSPP